MWSIGLAVGCLGLLTLVLIFLLRARREGARRAARPPISAGVGPPAGPVGRGERRRGLLSSSYRAAADTRRSCNRTAARGVVQYRGNAVVERWTGMGVVAGVGAGVLRMAGPSAPPGEAHERVPCLQIDPQGTPLKQHAHPVPERRKTSLCH